MPVIALAHACGVGRFERDRGVDVHRYERLFGDAPKLWRAVPLEDAQVVVYPHHYRKGEETARAAEAARKRGVPCIFFKSADDATPVHLPYGVIYRDSIDSAQQAPSERVLAAFADDLLHDRGGEMVVREKTDRPSIGFCGYVGTAFNRAIFRLTGRAQKFHGLFLRHRVLRGLGRSSRVDCKFIARARFWGGALGRFHRNVSRQVSVREEYLNNIFNTDYTVCLRGAGNFSYRFYEVLSAGRIPLFVNTRCVLPFASQIDWRRHCVWVEESELERAGDILADFHVRLSAEEFRAMQRANRKLWEDWLAPLSFYRRVLESEMAAE
ncbi:MAG TPA: exostosin family protein [Tepidisphaeraceae bacterium]|nr:exostosin family protein [Tepidisphaeraceae bacterium]